MASRNKQLRIGADGLTAKERQFVNEYLVDYNASAAARRCGYKSVPYQMLQKEEVRAAIEAGTMFADDAARYAISQQRIIDEYATIAFSRIDDVMRITENGEVVFDLAKVNGRRPVAAIAEVTQETYTEGKDGPEVKRTRVKFHDKMAALGVLAKMHSWMPSDKIEITGKDGGPVAVESKVDLSGLSVEELEALHGIATKVTAKKVGGD